MPGSAFPRRSAPRPNRTHSSGLGTRHLLAVLAVSGSAACGAAQASPEAAPALRAVLQIANAPLSESFASVVAGGRFLLFQEGLVVDLQTRKIAHRFPEPRLLRRTQQPHLITVAEYGSGGGVVDLVSGRFLCRAPLGSKLKDAEVDRRHRTCLLLTREREQLEHSDSSFTATVIDLTSGRSLGATAVAGPPGVRVFELRIEAELDGLSAWSIHAVSGIGTIPGGPIPRAYQPPPARHEIRLSATDGRPVSTWRELGPGSGLSFFRNDSPWCRGLHERDASACEPVADSQAVATVTAVPGVGAAWATGDLRRLVTRGEGFALWTVEEATRDATSAIPVELSTGSPSILLDPRKVVLAMATKPSLGTKRSLRPMIWDTQDGSWTERSSDAALGKNFFLSPSEFLATPCGVTFFARDGVVELILANPEAPRIGRPRGRSIARFVEFGDGGWIVLGDDGIYNGSAGATKHVAWFRPDGSLASTEEIAALYRPEELRRRIGAALDCKEDSD